MVYRVHAVCRVQGLVVFIGVYGFMRVKGFVG